MIIWMTGLSGSGKSTLALELLSRLPDACILDGDDLRSGLCKDLGFSMFDRDENIRRAGEVAKILHELGKTVICTFISPLMSQRDDVRRMFKQGDFVEVYCDASLKVCEKRDTKGLYLQARAGDILEFTGISSLYQPPSWSEIVAHTGAPNMPVAEVAKDVHNSLIEWEMERECRLA